MIVALLIAAIAFLFRSIAPQSAGEQMRRHIERRIQDHYPGLTVSIGRGRVEPDIGLILDDIQISERPADRSAKIGSADRNEMIRIDQIVVVATFNTRKLLEQQNPFTAQRILVNGLSADAMIRGDGSVSLERLWPPPKFSEHACPRMEIRDAKITLRSETGRGRPIEIDLSQALVLNHSGSAIGPPTVSGETRSAPASRTPSVVVSAKGSASFIDQFAVHVSKVANRVNVRVESQGTRLDGNMIDQVPLQWRDQLKPIRGLEVLADANASAVLEDSRMVSFAARGKVHDGRYRHPQSSMPVKGIRGVMSCDTSGLTLESFQAYWGETLIKFGGRIDGYRGPLQAQLDVSANNLMLDGRLATLLPAKHDAVWQKLQPQGLVDIRRARIAFDGDQVDTEAEVVCKGVDISYDKFPYPVRQITGTLRVRDNRVRTDLISGRTGGRLMQCVFDLPTRPDPQLPRVFSIAMDGPIAIDAELLQALSPRGLPESKLESFVRSLNPTGAVHLVRGTLRTDESGVKRKDFELKVSDGSLRFDKFPYPLYNVTGDIHVVDDLVRLSRFQGSNSNGGSIRCEGSYRIDPASPHAPDLPTPTPGPALDLEFDATRIAMDESLRSSLPDASRQTWDNLSPSGVLDWIRIDLGRSSTVGPLGLTIKARQFDSQGIGSDTLRIQPKSLPYRMDIVEGSARYEGGQVYIDSIRAQHGGSVVSANGSCKPTPQGRWLLTLDMHNGSRLVPDAEFVNALPETMRGAIRGLNLRGPVRLSGLTESLLSNEAFPDPVFGWDMVLQLEGNRIGDVGPVHGLRGELSIRGRKDTSGLVAEGDIRIDSLHVNELQLTRIRGPFQINDDQLRLGGIGQAGEFVRPIEGTLFDGNLRMDGNVRLSDASFAVRLALIEAKVPVLLAELGHGERDLTGTLVGSMNLEGLLGTRDLLRGRGRATVTNANLYQLPMLVQLLNVLSVSPTEDVAFTNADADFTLIENQIEFNDLKLWGSLIALHGGGTIDRRRELDLSFNTMVSPRNTFTRILRPIMDPRYTLWTVNVKGPLDAPDIERKALDGVGQTLERLFPGMNTGEETVQKNRSAGFGRMFQ